MLVYNTNKRKNTHDHYNLSTNKNTNKNTNTNINKNTNTNTQATINYKIKDEYVKIPLTPIQILHFKLLYNIVYFKKIYPDKISKLNLSEDLSELLDNEKEIINLYNEVKQIGLN